MDKSLAARRQGQEGGHGPDDRGQGMCVGRRVSLVVGPAAGCSGGRGEGTAERGRGRCHGSWSRRLSRSSDGESDVPWRTGRAVHARCRPRSGCRRRRIPDAPDMEPINEGELYPSPARGGARLPHGAAAELACKRRACWTLPRRAATAACLPPPSPSSTSSVWPPPARCRALSDCRPTTTRRPSSTRLWHDAPAPTPVTCGYGRARRDTQRCPARGGGGLRPQVQGRPEASDGELAACLDAALRAAPRAGLAGAGPPKTCPAETAPRPRAAAGSHCPWLLARAGTAAGQAARPNRLLRERAGSLRSSCSAVPSSAQRRSFSRSTQQTVCRSPHVMASRVSNPLVTTTA